MWKRAPHFDSALRSAARDGLSVMPSAISMELSLDIQHVRDQLKQSITVINEASHQSTRRLRIPIRPDDTVNALKARIAVTAVYTL